MTDPVDAARKRAAAKESRPDQNFLAGANAGAREALAPIQALHAPWTLWGDDCDHAITDDPREVTRTHPDGKHHWIQDLGWTCDRLYDVCSECCTDDVYQSEDCANHHEHSPGQPICKTSTLIYPAQEKTS